MLSLRRCAVTVTSISTSELPDALVSAVSAGAAAAAAEAPPRMAAIAYEILEFIAGSL
jgi:hypothetical protein